MRKFRNAFCITIFVIAFLVYDTENSHFSNLQYIRIKCLSGTKDVHFLEPNEFGGYSNLDKDLYCKCLSRKYPVSKKDVFFHRISFGIYYPFEKPIPELAKEKIRNQCTENRDPMIR